MAPLLEKEGRGEHKALRSGTAECWKLREPLPTAPSSPQMSTGGIRDMPVTQRSARESKACDMIQLALVCGFRTDQREEKHGSNIW